MGSLPEKPKRVLKATSTMGWISIGRDPARSASATSVISRKRTPGNTRRPRRYLMRVCPSPRSPRQYRISRKALPWHSIDSLGKPKRHYPTVALQLKIFEKEYDR